MARIFISYRRADSQAITGRIYDRLVAAFGKANVFKDVDSIPPGSTFVEVLDKELGQCNVMLVVIGRQWVTITDETGNRRLDNPEDFVRLEVERGLSREDMLFIPVLVDGAGNPGPNDLPPSLRDLSERQSVTVRHDPDFHRDMDRLITLLGSVQRQDEVMRQPAQRATKIFISYRRADTPYVTDHIYDYMRVQFGEGNVFLDVGSVPFGVDFRQYLNEQIADHEVVLVMIGPQWAQMIRDRAGRTDDFVRIEIESALRLNKLIIPVRVMGAELPDFSTLPASIQDLQWRNAAEIRRQPDFAGDCARLAQGIKEYLVRQLVPTVLAAVREVTPAPPPASPDNRKALKQPVPMDPVSLLSDRIKQLSNDSREQAMLIFEIDDLQKDDRYRAQVPDLLLRLTKRDDVLTVRNLRRTEELLGRLLPDSGREKSIPTAPAIVRQPPSPPTEPAAGTRRVDAVGIPMVYVPAGKFMMGSTEQQVEDAFHERKRLDKTAQKAWYEDQLPQHEQIMPQGFWLDLTPVTNEAYARFVSAGGYQKPDYWTEVGWAWVQKEKARGPKDYSNFAAPQQPRVGVTWFEAWAYAHWRGGRLPTESEWEWAAREPENCLYPWGNTFDASRLIYKENSGGKSAVVGEGIRQAGASWVGALDLSGNIWEWCSSLYHPYPYRARDGRENSLLAGSSPPVVRGGSWDSLLDYARASSRSFGLHPNDRSDGLGFRVVCDHL